MICRSQETVCMHWYHTKNTNPGSIASLICQEGRSERTFPIFAFSSSFFPLFPDISPLYPNFSWFFSSFPDFWQFFCCQGGHYSTLAPVLATPLTNLIYLIFTDQTADTATECKTLFRHYFSLLTTSNRNHSVKQTAHNFNKHINKSTAPRVAYQALN